MKKRYRAPKSIAIDLQCNSLLSESDIRFTKESGLFGGDDNLSPTSEASGDANIRTSSTDNELFDWNF